MNVKRILYFVLVLLVALLIIIPQVRINRLKNKLNAEMIKNLEQVDSLNYLNEQHLNTIKTYELQISELNSEIDSLKRIKNRIIIKKDEVIVSDNASSASQLLKKNLESWDE